MRNPNPRAEDNLKKYLKPPTWEQIDSLVKEVGVTIYRFESYYGLPFNHLAKVKCGLKQLGRAYWHIFYERIKPEYHLQFNKKAIRKTVPKMITKKIPKVIPTSIVENNDPHDRLKTVI